MVAISAAEAAGKSDTGLLQMGDAGQKHQRASFRIARETGLVLKKKRKKEKRFANLFIYSVFPKHSKR